MRRERLNLSLEDKNNLQDKKFCLVDNNSLIAEEKVKVNFFLAIGLMFIVLAFVFNSPREIWIGYKKILTSSANLITDYIELSNRGATFFNAGIMLLISLGMVKVSGGKINGVIIAAIFIVTGFSFFGKNLFNTMPITLGVLLIARLEKLPFKEYLPQALFATGLSPLVSEITFNLGLPLWQGLIYGTLVGIFTGAIIPPMATKFYSFHQGFNLYNVGFTAGIIGMIFMAILRSMGVDVLPLTIISSGNNKGFSLVLYFVFALILLLGLYANRWSMKGYSSLLALSGRSGTDFTETSGLGLTLVNMALLGIITTSYVLVIGGELNGPTIGGILTVVGFGAYGKHIKNVMPIFLGVLIAKYFNIYDHYSTSSILALLFGSTLAPIAGYYGVLAGIIAGFIHMAITMNIGYLHGGMNLYNNGFSGGFIAAALVPIFDTIIRHKTARANEK